MAASAHTISWALMLCLGWPALGCAPPGRTPVEPDPRQPANPYFDPRTGGSAAAASGHAEPDANPAPSGATESVPPPVNAGPQAGFVVDHRSTDISKIPPSWIERAQRQLVWIYGYTSHGSQLVTGAEHIAKREPSLRISTAYHRIPIASAPALRMSTDAAFGWEPAAFLARADAQITLANAAPGVQPVFMWSWCGELSEETGETKARAYLGLMGQLEQRHPRVRFVYMTGHTDAAHGEAVARANAIIREHAARHGKVLYDFADIESYLPDGTPAEKPSDGCPWCSAWCTEHADQCRDVPADCAHSHGLMCKLKAQALWWLAARIAGWPGPELGARH